MIRDNAIFSEQDIEAIIIHSPRYAQEALERLLSELPQTFGMIYQYLVYLQGQTLIHPGSVSRGDISFAGTDEAGLYAIIEQLKDELATTNGCSRIDLAFVLAEVAKLNAAPLQ